MKRVLFFIICISLLLASCNKKSDMDMNEKLIQAVKDGNLQVVRTSLARGASVNARRTANSKTPLHLASENGHMDIVKLLLEKGADVKKTRSGQAALVAALTAAAKNGRIDVVKLLLDKGADVNAKDFLGRTALMAAAKNGRTAVVKLLLAAKADVNAKENYGDTSLSIAQRRGHTEIARLLERAGATQPPSKIQRSFMPAGSTRAKESGTVTSNTSTMAVKPSSHLIGNVLWGKKYQDSNIFLFAIFGVQNKSPSNIRWDSIGYTVIPDWSPGDEIPLKNYAKEVNTAGGQSLGEVQTLEANSLNPIGIIAIPQSDTVIKPYWDRGQLGAMVVISYRGEPVYVGVTRLPQIDEVSSGRINAMDAMKSIVLLQTYVP